VKLTGDTYDYHPQKQNAHQFEIMYIFNENPDKTSTVIKNIRGSLLYQRHGGRGGHTMWRSSLSINLPACS
jgi:hypothetical protein